MNDDEGYMANGKTIGTIPPEPVQKTGTHPVNKTRVRELTSGEFPAADMFWMDYHETKGDPATDRIFAVFSGDTVVSLARCRRHTDGMDVDGIFTPAAYRRKGYSRLAVEALVEACHNDDLYMHAVRHLVGFYQKHGFVPIEEKALPSTIRERYVWAGGNLEGAEVQPMYRKAGLFLKGEQAGTTLYS